MEYRPKAMELWYREAPGSLLLQYEQQQLAGLLAKIPGEQLLQIGGPSDLSLVKSSIIRRQFFLSPYFPARSHTLRLQASLEALPLQVESIDLTVLVHMLAFAKQPQQLLQEIYTALSPGGQLIILGFNPYSAWGLAKWRRGRRGFPWEGRFWPASKLRYWLRSIGYSIVVSKTLCFRPPAEHAKQWQKQLYLESLGSVCLPWFGGIYLLLARKNTPGMTPLAEQWWLKSRKVKNGCVEPSARNSLNRNYE